jgi:transcription initiation factor TFIID subunit 1
MPNRGEQGTGKHGHKDTQEPYPHHEAKSTKDSGSHKGGTQHKASEHKSSEHKASEHKGTEHRASEHKSETSRSGGDSDLKSREYKDSHGNVHHHTRTAGKS